MSQKPRFPLISPTHATPTSKNTDVRALSPAEPTQITGTSRRLRSWGFKGRDEGVKVAEVEEAVVVKVRERVAGFKCRDELVEVFE